MIINKFKVENFKSFRLLTEFDLEVKNKDRNIILVEALNGVGKTSFLQAINACLFGISKTEFEKYLSYNSSNQSIYLDLEFYNTENFRKYRITRKYWINDSKSVLNLDIKVYIDDILQKDFAEEQWILFMQNEFPQEISKFFFFDGEKIQQIIDYRNPKEIKLAVEKILGIEEIRNLKDTLTQLRSDKIRQFGMNQNDKRYESLNLQLDDLNTNKENIKKDIKKLTNEAKILDEKTFNIKEEIDTLFSSGLSQKNLDTWVKYKEQLNDFKNKEIQIKEKISEFSTKNLDTFLLQNRANQILVETKADSNTEYKPLTSIQINKIINSLFCPTCINGGEIFDESKREDLVSKLSSVLNVTGNNQENNRRAHSSDYITSIQILNSHEIPDIESLCTQLTEIEDKELLLEREINALNRANNNESTIEDLRDKQELEIEFVNKKSSIEIQIENLQDQMVDQEKLIKDIEYELEGMMRTEETKVVEKDTIEILGGIISVLEEYIADLVEEKRQKLQKKTQELFSLISNTDKYKEIKISENYQVELYDSFGNLQEDLSSGFKQILMTSLIWGLKESSEKDFPIIIDTPLARLDPIHRKNIINNYFPNAAPQVIILSQPSEITSEDIQNISFNSHFRDSKYLQMNTDKSLDSTTIQTVQI